MQHGRDYCIVRNATYTCANYKIIKLFTVVELTIVLARLRCRQCDTCFVCVCVLRFEKESNNFPWDRIYECLCMRYSTCVNAFDRVLGRRGLLS